MRILLTGGAGFIGSHLAEALLERGDQVFCVDNFDAFYPRPYKESNIRWARTSERYELTEGDIRDAPLLRRIFAQARPDAVVHLAAKAGVRPSLDDPSGYVSVNLEGTVRLLETCRDLGVRKLVFASSSSVYGDDTPVPFREDAPANRPASPYAATKKGGEAIVHAFHHAGMLDAICLRYFTVYGPRQRPEMAIHMFARQLVLGRPIPLYGGGRLQRDFTYITDIVAGTLLALDHVIRSDGCFEIVNLGDSRTVRLDELVAMLEGVFGARAHVRPADRPAGDVERTWADISRARSLFGYDPRVPIEEGLRRFADWYAVEGAQLAASLAPARGPQVGVGGA